MSKRNKSQSNFFTIASLLKPYDYHTLFLYGGERRFDNMKSWFSGNGFDEIIDETNIENPEFVGTWGVSDAKKEIALMQFNDTYAFRSGNKVTVLRPDKDALTFLYKNEEMFPVEDDIKLEKNTLAFIIMLK